MRLGLNLIAHVLHLQGAATTSDSPIVATAATGRPADMQGPAVQAADLSAKQRLNIVLQSTFPYAECMLGLPRLEVFQVHKPCSSLLLAPVLLAHGCSWRLLLMRFWISLDTCKGASRLKTVDRLHLMLSLGCWC